MEWIRNWNLLRRYFERYKPADKGIERLIQVLHWLLNPGKNNSISSLQDGVDQGTSDGIQDLGCEMELGQMLIIRI
jgi:hypothetical protein